MPSRPEAASFEKVEIRSVSHAEGAGQIEALLGVPRHLLRNGEGWAVEEFTRLATHSVTHVDAPWHYNSVIQGKRAAAIDELPLEWFHAPGVVLDMTAKSDGERVDAGDSGRRCWGRSASRASDLLDIKLRLIRTDRDVYYGQADYILRGPAVAPEATRWLYDRGVRVMGIDAWGWDGPLDRQARQALARQEPGIFWAAHQCDLPYSQIERLVNLAALPSSGFIVSCFPLKIQGGSAGSHPGRGDRRRRGGGERVAANLRPQGRPVGDAARDTGRKSRGWRMVKKGADPGDAVQPEANSAGRRSRSRPPAALNILFTEMD